MNHTRNLLVIILVLTGTPVLCKADVTVSLRETAGIAGDYVRLEQVAEVDGDETEMKRVAGLYLGPVPPAGEIRKITRAQIRNRLLEVGLARMVRLIGSDAVMISRRKPGMIRLPATTCSQSKKRSVRIKQNDRTRKLLTHLAGQAVRRYMERSMQRDDLELNITVENLKGEMNPQTGNMVMERILSGRLPGRARVMLQSKSEPGEIRAKFTAMVEVRAFAQVLFLRRSLQRGQMLQPEDLMIRKTELKQNIAYMPLDPKALAGRQAARFLRAMSPLKHGDLEIPAAVVKDQLITVKTMAGAFNVTMRVRSLGTARPGELVTVENLDSKKQFMVRVTGFGTACMPQDGR